MEIHGLQSEKREKYYEESQVNELQRKQPRSKNFELVLFGDSITKRIDPSFIIRRHKSLALSYLVGIAKVRGVCEQMRTFREIHQEAAVTNNLRRLKSPFQRTPW